MATKSKSKGVSVKGTEMQYSDQLPAYMDLSSQLGNESVGRDDIAIPRIAICQALSPQRKKSNDEYIAGIEEGDLFNTVTNAVFKNGIDFVPVLFVKEYIVWVSRETDPKGGYRGSFRTEIEAAEFVQTQDDAKSLEIVDTASNYGFIINDDTSVEQVVISMSKSQLKVSRKFNSMIKLAGGDRFSRAYRVSTVEEKGSKGDFINYHIAALGYVTEKIYKTAKKSYTELKQIASAD